MIRWIEIFIPLLLFVCEKFSDIFFRILSFILFSQLIDTNAVRYLIKQIANKVWHWGILKRWWQEIKD